MNVREIFWIDYYKSTDRKIGYNIAKGGTGGDTISNHPNKVNIGKRHSIALTGKDTQRTTCGPLSEETKSKISKKLSGTNNPMYGKTHTLESKEKISVAQLKRSPNSRKCSNATKEKIANSNKGKIVSEQTKIKQSIAKLGNKNPMYGKTHTLENRKIFSRNGAKPKSESTKQKLSDANKGKYRGSQNKPFIANNTEYSSLGDCHRQTSEPIYMIRKKLFSGEYIYTIPS